MKLFLATIALLVSFYIIKVDLFEGTIPLAYSSEIQMEKCIESPNYIVAEIMPGKLSILYLRFILLVKIFHLLNV